MKSTDDRLQPDISELFACSHHTDLTTLLIKRRCFRLQLAVSEMVREAEDKLLSAVRPTSNQFHVLRRLFPPTIERKYSLRLRKHDFVLPPKDDKNFIPRVLYSSLLNR